MHQGEASRDRANFPERSDRPGVWRRVAALQTLG